MSDFLNKHVKDYQTAYLGFFLMLGMVLTALIVGGAFLQVKRYPNEVVTVTGSAAKLIASDSVEWTCRFARRGDSMKVAYDDLAKDAKLVQEYLKKAGITAQEMAVAPVNTVTLYRRTDQGYSTEDVIGYRLEQAISVKSTNVVKVDKASRESTELISQGVGFTSDPPNYYYTKLDSLKVEMLGAATQDAYNRAQSMAKATGRSIGQLRTANMGVFQITGENSTEVSDYGINDTSSQNKKVTAVVNATFEMAH